MIEGADDSISWICYRDFNKKHLQSENFRLRVPYEFKFGVIPNIFLNAV